MRIVQTETMCKGSKDKQVCGHCQRDLFRLFDSTFNQFTRYFIKIRNTDSHLLFINRDEIVLFEYCRCLYVCLSFLSLSLLFWRAMILRQIFLLIFRRASVLIRSNLMLVEKFMDNSNSPQ